MLTQGFQLVVDGRAIDDGCIKEEQSSDWLETRTSGYQSENCVIDVRYKRHHLRHNCQAFNSFSFAENASETDDLVSVFKRQKLFVKISCDIINDIMVETNMWLILPI